MVLCPVAQHDRVPILGSGSQRLGRRNNLTPFYRGSTGNHEDLASEIVCRGDQMDVAAPLAVNEQAVEFLPLQKRAKPSIPHNHRPQLVTQAGRATDAVSSSRISVPCRRVQPLAV